MTDSTTFANDQGNTGTTESTFNQDSDQSNGNNNDAGNALQEQVNVMQKRLGDKDQFIDTLKGENKALLEKVADIAAKVDSMGTLEEKLARMEAAKESNQDTTLDEEQLVSRVLGTIKHQTEEERREANFLEVSDKLTKKFGAGNVDSVASKAAADAGLSLNDMFDMARKSPKAVYKMLGIADTQLPASPSHSTNTGYEADVQTREQKLAAFSKLRRENPAEYYKAETQKAFREACLS